MICTSIRKIAVSAAGRVFCVGLVLSAVVVTSLTALAQSPVTWSEPQQMSPPDISSGAPALAVDATGNVHLMWSQVMLQTDRASDGDTLFYRRWDGQQWTPPVDVQASTEGDARYPEIIVTADGTLHAVWNSAGNLMYAHAPACCADNVRAWSQPIKLASAAQTFNALATDVQGRLHIVFSYRFEGSIAYLRSDDGGLTWPIYTELSTGTLTGEEYALYPRVAVDGRGRVHAVWTVEPWPGRYVMYARSDDGGDTWSAPQIIDRFDSGNYRSEGYGPILINVATHGEDEVHLIWDGAPTVERNHIWSSDGGKTWTKPQTLFPEITLVGRSGWNDMAHDSAGTLHAVALGQPLHAFWAGENWSASTPIGQGRDSQGAEWMRLALGLGNQLHVAWVDKGISPNQVWYQFGQTTSPALAPQPLPIAALLPISKTTVVSMASAIVTFTVPAESSQIGVPIVIPRTAPVHTLAPEAVVAIGVLPAVVLVGIIFAVRLRRSKS